MRSTGLRPLHAWLVLSLACASCATVGPAPRAARPEVGFASYYGRTHDGRRTASGERFDQDEMTAAHRTLPFGTRVRVTNLQNGRTVVVRINDRGPWRKHRVIDVSYAAGRKLGLIGPGTARVRLDVIPWEPTAESSVPEER
jgi:rare lipoprotein A